METLFSMFANSLLLPPGLNITLLIIGLSILQRYFKLGIGLIAMSTVSLYLFSTLAIATHLISPLQQQPPIKLNPLPATTSEQAIVVLTSGSRYAPEYQQHQPTYYSLLRELYGVSLVEHTKLPIIIVGGKGSHSSVPEAMTMQRHLAERFRIATVWIESESRNTWENAKNLHV